MNGDFSRSTFRSYKNYASVRMQQGRVQLDADWNEAEDIRSHIERTAFRDAIGITGAPKKASGYAIGLTPDGSDLTITTGRMYVEGLLAELEGEAVAVEEVHEDWVVVPALWADGRALAAPQWIELFAEGTSPVRTRIASVEPATRTVRLDPALSAAEVAALGANASLRRIVSYATQPDLPDAPLVSGTPPTLALPEGAYLVYVDVWERHVTALDDPDLRETALGGPDTATRSKIVCQVRLQQLEGPLIAHCDEVPEPAVLLDARGVRTATTGRMKAQAVPGDPGSEPCDLSASGGYRRLENQLYRIEIHEGGPRASATFKWSRDNASMTARWLSAPSTSKLQVSSAGPDDVLGFASGQLVELIDDTRELNGIPGTLVHLSAPPEGNVLTIDPTTPVDRASFPGNPKVRRWDCPTDLPVAGASGSDGWVELEDGVEVRFDEGWYNTGDHWLVPARTAEGNVEWPADAGGAAVAREPDGTAHHYAKLALLRSDGTSLTLLEDCRDPFPALTDLAAVDVTYDNATCQLPGARTVQDALDRLCEEHTLRRHKRTLHGWGIVCGLQVACSTDDQEHRDAVQVRDGYAIDAEGNDLLLEQDTRIDIVQKIGDHERVHANDANHTPLLTDGNGEVSLFMQLDRDRGDLRFDIERFDPRQDRSRDKLLAGTMWMDFYNECILPVEKFFREELADERRDGAANQRRAVLVGLIANFLNQQSGQFIAISAEEDEILRSFYGRLKALLTSETFCAMFDNARPFPDYPLRDVAIDTIFGRGHHTRVRIRPGATPEAYTVGPGLNLRGPTIAINRYDLERKRLVGSYDPIAGNRVVGRFKRGTDAVRDVAFSKDGKRIYAIAPTRNGRDTLLRVGDIEQDQIRWGQLHTICGVRLVTLGTSAKDPSHLYAIGVGSGVYRINPDAPDLSPSPVAAFNATGQMVVTEEGQAFALGASGEAGRGVYDRLHGFQLPGGGRLFDAVAVPAGRDDLAIASTAADTTLFVAVGHRERRILAFDGRTGRPRRQGGQDVSIAVGTGPVSLQVCAPTGVLLIALEDAFRVRLIDLETIRLVTEFVPAQVGPSSIGVDERTRAAYVLNTVSSTITVAGFDLLHPQLDFPYEALAAYRRGILDAFADLAGGFLQYLKDCLCDHFLVRCPEPTGDEKIYLAAVSMRNEQVYKVCNFSKRRYVKSFPAVGYWLSLVPIAPMIDRLIEAFCCWIIPDYFGRFAAKEARTFEEATGRFKPSALRSGAFAVQEYDPMSKLTELLMQFKLAAGQMMSGFGPSTNNYAAPAPPPEEKRPVAAIMGTKAEDAQVTFANLGYVVETKPYEQPDPLGVLRAAIRKPRPGEKIQILEQDGVVRGVTVVPTEHELLMREVGVAVEAAPALAAEVTELRTKLETRETELSMLTSRLAEVEGRHETLSALIRARAQVQPAKSAKKPSPRKAAAKRKTSKKATKKASAR